MIYVSQGHERGVGLEIFLKSFSKLSTTYQNNLILFCNIETLKIQMRLLGYDFNITPTSIFYQSCELKIRRISNLNLPQSTDALLEAMNLCKSSDILLTLPTSKDQIILNKKVLSGHTELFRSYYNMPNLPMTFLSHDSNFLLLTDHISLDKVLPTLSNKDYILDKIRICLENFPIDRNINEVYFAGFNPHCGENGVIGEHDRIINEVLDMLKIEYKHIHFHQMMAADTIHFNIKNKNQLFIFGYHDQALGIFKQRYGLSGINFTQGLPFKRISVDHGTAFDLYGKNCADTVGMDFLLEEIKNW